MEPLTEFFLPVDEDYTPKQPKIKKTVIPTPKTKRTHDGEGNHLRKGIPDLSVIDIVPPPRFWTDIAQFRRKYVAYMPYDAPHISFINPFLVIDDLEAAARLLTKKYEDLVPCTVTMRKVDTMPRKRKNNITVFVQPEVDPPDGLEKLMHLFLEVFPQCNELWIRHGRRFTPHLTIAQFSSEDEYNATFPEIESLWKPFSFTLKEIYFITRPLKRHPFEVMQVIPIGAHVTPPYLGPGLVVKDNKLHRTLVVIGIRNIDEDTLFAAFSKTGPVVSVRLLPNTTKTWCCGLVEFTTREAAEKSVRTYDCTVINENDTYVKLLVNLMMVVEI